MTEKEETRLARAMLAIFATPNGKVLKAYLQERAMTLSAIANGSVLVDQRSTDIHEGQRYEALKLLGAKNSITEGDQ